MNITDFYVMASYFIALTLSAALLALLLRTGIAWRLAMDVPNDRSLHVRPTPRIGGLGVIPAVLLLTSWHGDDSWLSFLVLALAVISFLDDRFGLSSRLRFAGHMSTAIVCVYCLGLLHQTLWLVVPAVVTIVWMTNLYNFMDGADGLAGGMAVIGFGAYALAGLQGGQTPLVVLSVCIAGAASGFLLFNFPPARVFLGDAGSIPLGFLAATVGLMGLQEGVWPIWFPLLVFSPFIADSTVTLLKRLLRRERFWQAHRGHYYQRMIRMAGNHRRPVMQWYGCMLMAATLALAGLQVRLWWQAFILVAWITVLFVVARIVDDRWQTFIGAHPDAAV